MILAIAVDNSLDPGRVSEIDIEQTGKELTDASTVVAECRYRAHMLPTRTVCQEFSELICCRAVYKRVIRNTRKHIAIVIATTLLVWNPHTTVGKCSTNDELYLCI